MSSRQLVFVIAFASVGGPGVGSTADEPAKTEASSPAPKNDADHEAERKRRGEFLKADFESHTVVAADRRERSFATTDSRSISDHYMEFPSGKYPP